MDFRHSLPKHDLKEFVQRQHQLIGQEYSRISAKSKSDPGTAGDNGEENWANILRLCLPSYFKIITKGVIIDRDGNQSPQLDILVLCPSYPAIMQQSKYYLEAGVVAAFECKLTLRSGEVQKAVQTASLVKGTPSFFRNADSPFTALHSPIYFGLLAHSHSWKDKRATPLANIKNGLQKALDEHARTPRQMIDSIVISDLAAWVGQKSIQRPRSNKDQKVSQKIQVSGGLLCEPYRSQESPEETPIGNLINHLSVALSWRYPDMMSLSAYFSDVFETYCCDMDHSYHKQWDGRQVFSSEVLKRIEDGECEQVFSGEWSSFYFH